MCRFEIYPEFVYRIFLKTENEKPEYREKFIKRINFIEESFSKYKYSSVSFI